MHARAHASATSLHYAFSGRGDAPRAHTTHVHALICACIVHMCSIWEERVVPACPHYTCKPDAHTCMRRLGRRSSCFDDADSTGQPEGQRRRGVPSICPQITHRRQQPHAAAGAGPFTAAPPQARCERARPAGAGYRVQGTGNRPPARPHSTTAGYRVQGTGRPSHSITAAPGTAPHRLRLRRRRRRRRRCLLLLLLLRRRRRRRRRLARAPGAGCRVQGTGSRLGCSPRGADGGGRGGDVGGGLRHGACVRACVRACACAHACMCMRACACVCVHVHMCLRVCARALHMHTPAHICTYMHTCIHRRRR